MIGTPVFKAPTLEIAYEAAFELAIALRPVIDELSARDAALAERLQRAVTGALVNLALAQRPHERAKYRAVETARSEACEVLVYLDAAHAIGWLDNAISVRETCERLVRLCWKLG
ncbi:MAG TPA: four helix bundle protein [Kofleriaceae bacterium]|jgi:four helix bundle protein|nr:four helix bundle protein [Kofleriaceae bacterium]